VGAPESSPPDIIVGIKIEAGHLARYGKAMDAQDTRKSIIQRKKEAFFAPSARFHLTRWSC
jgi:hypothetical protein